MTHVIDKFEGHYFFLRNFWVERKPLIWNGYPCATAEHAFQMTKTINEPDRRAVVGAATPGQAKKLGRKCVLRDDWEDIKLTVMENVLRLKFKDKLLRGALCGTGDAELIEGNWWGDTFWGVCDGKGENHLGKLLMRLRDEYQLKCFQQ